MTKCRKCGAEIEFVRMKSGKHMPVDPGKKPVRLGGSEIYITPDGETLRGHKPLAGEPTDDYLYTPHWATCPFADDFRR